MIQDLDKKLQAVEQLPIEEQIVELAKIIEQLEAQLS